MIKCERKDCKHNKEFICMKETIFINDYGRCKSYRNKNNFYHTKEPDFNKLTMNKILKHKKTKMYVIKNV